MDLPKLVPKSPIMTWNEDLESPDVTPRDGPQFPFNDPNISRDSYRDRSPLQQRQNTQNMQNPYEQNGFYDQQQKYPNGQPFQRGQPNDRVDQGQMERSRDSRSNYPGYFDDRGSLRESQRSSHAYNPSGEYGTLTQGQAQAQGQAYVPQNRMQGRPPDDTANHSMDNRYPGDRLDQNRTSQRSLGQGRPGLADDQRSGTSAGQSSTASYPKPVRDQYSTSSLPRGHKPSSYDQRGPPSLSSLRDQGQSQQSYNSLPREPKHHDAVSRSGRQGYSREVPSSQSPPGRFGGKRDDKNPYMVMSSPQSSMDETRLVHLTFFSVQFMGFSFGNLQFYFTHNFFRFI